MGRAPEAQAEASVNGQKDASESEEPREKDSKDKTHATKDLSCNRDSLLGADLSADTSESVTNRDMNGAFGPTLHLAGLKALGYDSGTSTTEPKSSGADQATTLPLRTWFFPYSKRDTTVMEDAPRDEERTQTTVPSTAATSSYSSTPQALSSMPPSDPPGYKMYAATPEEMAKDWAFYASTDFIISCGCVTVDKRTSKVLLIFNKKLNIYQLPKGRKDIGEGLNEAAIRETREETGVAAEAQPSWVPTRATLAAKDGGGAGRPEIETVFCQEPIAVIHSPDPYSGAMKMVFYFLAVADSTEMPRQGTQEEWENFSNLWVSADEAVRTLTFKEDQRVVDQAVVRFQELGVKF